MAFSPADRREFGRRPTRIPALALLPGDIRLPCIIANLSDGGAFLIFTGGAAPTQSFRLAVDDTHFNLLCEVRHRTANKMGVRFVSLAEGIELNRHFRRTEAPHLASSYVAPARRPHRTGNTPSVRELRRALLGIADEPQPALAVGATTTPTAGDDHSDASCAREAQAIEKTVVAPQPEPLAAAA